MASSLDSLSQIPLKYMLETKRFRQSYNEEKEDENESSLANDDKDEMDALVTKQKERELFSFGRKVKLIIPKY
jgi:hypothetical protein